jgi:hypothetical protein
VSTQDEKEKYASHLAFVSRDLREASSLLEQGLCSIILNQSRTALLPAAEQMEASLRSALRRLSDLRKTLRP